MSNGVDKSSDIDSVYRKSKSSRGGGGGTMNEFGEEVFWAAGTFHNACTKINANQHKTNPPTGMGSVIYAVG